MRPDVSPAFLSKAQTDALMSATGAALDAALLDVGANLMLSLANDPGEGDVLPDVALLVMNHSDKRLSLPRVSSPWGSLEAQSKGNLDGPNHELSPGGSCMGAWGWTSSFAASPTGVLKFAPTGLTNNAPVYIGVDHSDSWTTTNTVSARNTIDHGTGDDYYKAMMDGGPDEDKSSVTSGCVQIRGIEMPYESTSLPSMWLGIAIITG